MWVVGKTCDRLTRVIHKCIWVLYKSAGYFALLYY